MKSIKNAKPPRLSLKYTLTPRSMSSRTVQCTILGDFAYISYLCLFIYDSKSLTITYKKLTLSLNSPTKLQPCQDSNILLLFNCKPGVSTNRFISDDKGMIELRTLGIIPTFNLNTGIYHEL